MLPVAQQTQRGWERGHCSRQRGLDPQGFCRIAFDYQTTSFELAFLVCLIPVFLFFFNQMGKANPDVKERLQVIIQRVKNRP